jgi:hypothetical protein
MSVVPSRRFLSTSHVSHIEVRELCKVLKLTVAQLDRRAGKLEAGLHLPVTPGTAKRSRKKR